MRNRTAVTLSLVMFAALVNAQDSTQTFPRLKNTIGIEVTGLIPMSNGDYGPRHYYPYFLTYRRALCSGYARAGVGGWGRTNENSSSGSMTNSGTQSQWWLNARLGYAWTLFDLRKWRAFAGADVVWEHLSYTSSGQWSTGESSKTTESMNGLGLAPMVEVHWRINENIALGTEANLVFLRSHTERERTNLPDQTYDSIETTDSFTLEMIDAFSLFLLVSF